jgi:hypothetical protein
VLQLAAVTRASERSLPCLMTAAQGEKQRGNICNACYVDRVD